MTASRYTRQQAAEVGTDEYLGKPVELDALLAVVAVQSHTHEPTGPGAQPSRSAMSSRVQPRIGAAGLAVERV